MKQQVFHIHGGMAFSKNEDYLEHLRTTPIDPHPPERPKRWSDSLQEDLGDEFEVFKPEMPTKYNSKYEEWAIWFERHFEFLHDDVIFTGWSQGGMFLLRYLGENDVPFSIKALHIISAPCERDVYGSEDGGEFYTTLQNIQALPSKAGEVHIWHSEDDFVVSYTHAKKLSELMPEATFHSFTDRNHFLLPEFPELVANIKGL